MRLTDIPFGTTDWSAVEPTEHPGEAGVARWRTCHFGAVRVRMVEYSPGYRADHWCEKGHILLCLSGELETERYTVLAATLAILVRPLSATLREICGTRARAETWVALSYAGMAIGTLLAGNVLTEVVFNWPGIGLYAVNAIRYLDYAAIMGVTLIVSTIYVFVNLMVDIAYVVLDPRISYASAARAGA